MLKFEIKLVFFLKSIKSLKFTKALITANKNTIQNQDYQNIKYDAITLQSTLNIPTAFELTK